MRYFIDVILPIPLATTFTYEVSEAESVFLSKGIRVAVPFGKKKIYTALVLKVHQQAPEKYDAKEIHQILDEYPIVSEKQMVLWEWIATYYMCTIGEVMKASLPSSFLLASETLISKGRVVLEDDSLSDEEFLVLEALENNSELRVQEVMNILERKNIFKILKRLVDVNAVVLREEIFEQYKPKKVRYVKLHSKYVQENLLHELLDELSRAKKQKEVILAYFALQHEENKGITVSDLKTKSQASSAIIKALIDKGVLIDYFEEEDRISFEGTIENQKQLSLAQENAFQEIKEEFQDHSTVLFHGVTSSGKTEVYAKLIEEELAKGNQVLYLLPEIALTTQLIGRLQKYFGDHVAVFHSKYSNNERVEVWNNVVQQKKKAQLIIGARSSVLLPFTNLGLIIIDEEHETSFKQFDPAPRYHARDTAIVLGGFHKAKVLLGSATPSIESFFNAVCEKKYGLVSLKERYGNILLPEINLVDIKEKYKRKEMKGHFSDTLIKAIEGALEEQEQVILFQNRRGFSPIVECNTCGHATQCPNCDVSLTYHHYKNQLRCHYCGYHMAMQNACLSCGSHDLDTKGFGTEQIEEEVKQLFESARVKRMDLDTTRGKHGYEKIISAFERHEVDILVGTQMLTKGLDFKKVSLVGILNADQMLNFPDFRAHERSFQLMQQVAGRSGRSEKRGKVLIQTFNPYHKILQQVSTNAYEEMYHEQLDQRHVYKYPPTNRIIKFSVKDRDYNKVNDAAHWFGKSLSQLFGTNVFGPEFPPIARIRNQYIKNILLKIPSEQSLRATKKAILKIQNSFNAISQFKSVRIIINVDNY